MQSQAATASPQEAPIMATAGPDQAPMAMVHTATTLPAQVAAHNRTMAANALTNGAADDVMKAMVARAAPSPPVSPQYKSPPGEWYDVHPFATTTAAPLLGDLEHY